MKAYQEIPSTYHEFGNIDLQKDWRAMLTVNGIGLAIMIVMVVGCHSSGPFVRCLICPEVWGRIPCGLWS